MRETVAFAAPPPDAMLLAMKEIYGWLLLLGLASLIILAVSYGPLRPRAIFPKWSTLRKGTRRLVRIFVRSQPPPPGNLYPAGAEISGLCGNFGILW